MKPILLLGALAALAACAAPNNDADFLCGAQEGQPCRTMSDVDGRSTGAQRPTQALTQSRVSAQQAVAGGTDVRLPEQTGRMWVGPHVGSDGVVHEEATVRFVVRNARWASK